MLGLTTPPLIAPEAGFRVELGGLSPDSIASPVLEEVEKHSLYYKNNFCNKGTHVSNSIQTRFSLRGRRPHQKISGGARSSFVFTKADCRRQHTQRN